MYAWSPTGSGILGTLEIIQGRCDTFRDGFSRAADGTLEYDHSGNGTEMFWDGAETASKDGESLFLDEDGEEWKESELILTEDDEPPADADLEFCKLIRGAVYQLGHQHTQSKEGVGALASLLRVSLLTVVRWTHCRNLPHEALRASVRKAVANLVEVRI
jgi:hypothetical protein